MANNTENNFRNAFQSFGARGGVAAGDSSASNEGSAFSRASDWFGGVRNQVSGYVPIQLGGTPAGPPPEDEWFGLTWFQRMAGFGICLAGAIMCFLIAFFIGLPLVLLSPSKFATSFTLGSLLLMSSVALLKGPLTHFRSITSRERLPFSLAYFGSMFFTLIFSLVMGSYILTIIGVIVQAFALIWYFFSYNPFAGDSSIRLGTNVARSLLPI